MRNDRFMHDCEQVKVSPKALITVVATATLVRRWPPSNQRFRPRRFREQRSLSKYALRLSIAKQGRGSSQPRVSCPRFLWTPYCPEKLEDDSVEGNGKTMIDAAGLVGSEG